jgi:preprotein translocase subunit SecD
MLATVAIFVVALYLGMLLGPAQTPALGLDLRGGTQVILTAKPITGTKVTKGALNQAVDIIRARVNGAGVGGAQISTQGSSTIVVSAPGASRDQLAALDQTALLRFRQVLQVGAYASQAIVPVPSGTPSAILSPSPITKSISPAAKKHRTTTHDLMRPSLLQSVPMASTTPSPSPSPSGATSPTPSTSGSTTPTPSPSPTASIGPAPGAASTDLKTVEATFAKWDCSANNNPTAGVDAPTDYIVSCDNTKDQQFKYLLAPAGTEGSEISSAAATIDATTNQWRVNLTFNHSGSGHWLALTAKAAKQPDMPSCTPPAGCNAVAIVLDGVVQSAPRITDPNGIPGGQAEITGNFSQSDASNLANVLKFGALPLKLVTQSVSSISASLGSDQLRGGLIAGGIGLVLVILYSLLYYRALGFVTIASLLLSGGILYAVTTLLGHSSLGYTLSLPGIAGFIVAVGITADSFVVFFERIRDEVREGRRLRSGVERAWPRARRTIISADAVSLLAAVVLYLVSIGDVRGFAFTLGLSTLSDLFIVFFFTKPLLAVLARSKAFDSGAGWTGVGRARSGAVLEPREA